MKKCQSTIYLYHLPSLKCAKQGCIELETMQKTIHLLHLSNLS